MSLTNDFESLILEHVFKIAPLGVPANIKVALFTADPGEAGSLVNEVVAGEYVRQDCDAWTNDGQVGGYCQVSNTNIITFPTAVSDWGAITYVGLIRAVDNKMIASGLLAVSVHPVAVPPTVVSFPVGTLKVQLN